MTGGHPLPAAAAHILSGLVSISYVLSLYLSQSKSKNQQWRNDPAVIKRRLLAASLSTTTNCLLVTATVWATSFAKDPNSVDATLDDSLALLGFATPSSTKAHLVTPLLFLGPLYAQFLAQSLPSQAHFNIKDDLVDVLLSWPGFRNFVVAPFTEEVTYRACVLAFLHLGNLSKASMIFVSPCWFGLAHVHHGYETYVRYGKTNSALRHALIGTFIQFAYTTVFGWYCSYLFLRTGSLAVPSIAHIFCNIMGLPQVRSELSQHPHHKAHILAAYAMGIIGFVFTLQPWTQTEGSIYWSA